MPDFTGGTDYWKDIPNGVVEQDTRQTSADDWAAQQRAQLAQQWADGQRQQLSEMHPALPTAPTPSDSLTNPIPSPDLAAGVQQAPAPPPLSADLQSGPTPPAPAPAANPAPRGPLNDVSQFGQAGLSYDEALAACGPAAAVRLLSIYGQNIPLQAALSAAKEVGWTNAGGMNGIGNEKRLLDKLGVPAIVDTAPSMAKIISDAQSGNPVTLSTPNHYFTLTDYNPNTGMFHVGQSGLAFRGGSADMTWDQIKRIGGGVNGALFVDSPASQQPGTAALDTGSADRYVTPPAAAPTAAPVDPTFGLAGALQGAGQALGNAGGAVQQAVGNAGNAVGQAVGAVGNAVQQAPSNFADILNQARQSVGYAGDQAQQAVQGFAGPQPMAASQQPTPSDTLTNPTMQQNPTTPAAGTLQPPPSGPGAFDKGGFVDNLNTIRKQVAPSVLDSEFAQRNDMSNPENAINIVAAMSGGSGKPADPYEAALNVPANKATATMLSATPPKPLDDGLVTRAVRALTNRNVSVDQFQNQVLSGAGLSTSNPPEALDLAARIRQFATDGAVKVAEDTVLKPAVQSLGDNPAAQKALSSVLVHQNNIDVASATGNTYRKFPGGGSLIQSQTALNQMKQALGPQEWAKVQGAADQVYGLVGDMRQQMLDSGLIDQHTYSTWQGQQPHYIPTRILDYLDENGGPAVGSKVTLSDNGVRHYSQQGTDRFQEDPLGSVLSMVNQVSRNARKNEAVKALLDLDQLSGTPQLKPTTAPATAGSSIVQYVRDGKVERYVAPPQLAAVVNGPAVEQFPKWVQNFTGFQRAVNTVLSPAFALVRNPTLDVPEYLLRQTARAGGNPLAIPHIISELGKGYADAFQGLLQGKFAGPGTQQFLKGGGSGSTMVSTFENRADIVKNLAGGTQISSVGDLQRILKSVLGAVPAVAERTELGPRVAAMRLAEQQGATPLRATMAGRTVTMDFNEGGTFAKSLNQAIPFLNAGVQGTVIPIRMFKENPAGALAAATMMVGLPAVAAEAWNNSDPQRAKDYADVPQYLKQGGVVFMAPGQASVDKEGNRKPGFFWLNMRGMAPFADIARQAAATGLRIAGNKDAQPEDWGQLLSDMTAGVSPVRANTIGDVGNALTGPGLLPGAAAIQQLNANKDMFRGSDIVSKYHDQASPASAQALAAGLTAVAQAINPKAEIHPSQVDFAIKQLLGGVGGTAEGAADPIANAGGYQSSSTSTPVVGGLAKAAGIRNDTGQSSRDATEQRTPNDITEIFKDAGLPASYQPAPVDSTVTVGRFKVPLTQDEQTQIQRLTSRNIADEVRSMAADPSWAKASPESKQAAIKRTETRLHSQAERQILSTLSDAEIRRRIP